MQLRKEENGGGGGRSCTGLPSHLCNYASMTREKKMGGVRQGACSRGNSARMGGEGVSPIPVSFPATAFCGAVTSEAPETNKHANREACTHTLRRNTGSLFAFCSV